VRGTKPLGGDIMIHGDCVTIGCIPLTNDGIDEVYLAAVDARAALVHVFPRRLDDDGVRALPDDPALRAFWQELVPIYATFERTHRVPRVDVDAKTGAYVIRSE
jgi:murein L,D-transpeptidase YafK